MLITGSIDQEILNELVIAIENNKLGIDSLTARVDGLENRVDDLIENPPTGASENLMLYYTSKNCTGCKEVDEKIKELKAKGMPIVTTILAERDASLTGVPKIYYPYKDVTISGVSNCQFHLAGLLSP